MVVGVSRGISRGSNQPRVQQESWNAPWTTLPRGEYAQAKLVSCLHGSIFNVAVDIRPGDTFGYAYGEILSFENQKQMYIPRGFAHGYLTLEDDTLMQWCVDNDFCAEAARAVRYDSDFIWESESWPEGEYIVSEKDRNAEKFPFSIAKDK